MSFPSEIQSIWSVVSFINNVNKTHLRVVTEPHIVRGALADRALSARAPALAGAAAAQRAARAARAGAPRAPRGARRGRGRCGRHLRVRRYTLSALTPLQMQRYLMSFISSIYRDKKKIFFFRLRRYRCGDLSLKIRDIVWKESLCKTRCSIQNITKICQTESTEG